MKKYLLNYLLICFIVELVLIMITYFIENIIGNGNFLEGLIIANTVVLIHLAIVGLAYLVNKLIDILNQK